MAKQVVHPMAPPPPPPPLQRIQSLNSVGLPVPPKREPPIGLPLVENQIRRPNQLNLDMRPNHSVIAINQRHIPSATQLPMSPVRHFSFSHHSDDGSDTPPQPPPRRRSSAAGIKPKIELRFKPFDEERNGDKVCVHSFDFFKNRKDFPII